LVYLLPLVAANCENLTKRDTDAQGKTAKGRPLGEDSRKVNNNRHEREGGELEDGSSLPLNQFKIKAYH
jgi:hypothetical protein